MDSIKQEMRKHSHTVADEGEDLILVLRVVDKVVQCRSLLDEHTQPQLRVLRLHPLNLALHHRVIQLLEPGERQINQGRAR